MTPRSIRKAIRLSAFGLGICGAPSSDTTRVRAGPIRRAWRSRWTGAPAALRARTPRCRTPSRPATLREPRAATQKASKSGSTSKLQIVGGAIAKNVGDASAGSIGRPMSRAAGRSPGAVDFAIRGPWAHLVVDKRDSRKRQSPPQANGPCNWRSRSFRKSKSTGLVRNSAAPYSAARRRRSSSP